MREKQDPWHKPRGHGNHFTTSEIDVIAAAFKAKTEAKEVAELLQCSSRSVQRYFVKLRENQPLRKDTRQAIPIIEIKRGAVDRLYHGNFEL